MLAASTAIRPRNLSEILDEMFRVYRRHFVVIAGVSIILTIPSVVLYGAILQPFLSSGALQPGSTPQWGAANIGIGGVAAVISLALLPLSNAIVRAAVDALTDPPVTIGRALLGTFKRYWALWAVMLLYFALVLGSILIITIPLMIWMGLRLSLAVPALFAENMRAGDAIGRSWSLVERRWWRTFGILALVYLMLLVINQVIGFVVGFVVALIPGLNPVARSFVTLPLSTLVGALTSPLGAIGLTLVYFDLRARREGGDLDLLAQRAATPWQPYGNAPAPQPGTGQPPPYPSPPQATGHPPTTSDSTPSGPTYQPPPADQP